MTPSSNMPSETDDSAVSPPSKQQIRRWQRYLANERAEAAVYRELAFGAEGETREILLSLAEAESRHEEHWRNLLGDQIGLPRQADLSTRLLALLAKRFGSVFTLALLQTAEQRSPYSKDADATDQMIADEQIHAEVVRGLAARGREKMSGNFRAAVFGANDGLVSNLALILSFAGAGASNHFILLAGLSGLLAGALSMAAGEYVSVASQNELLKASTPNPATSALVRLLDVDANELALVYRARGMDANQAAARAEAVLKNLQRMHPAGSNALGIEEEVIEPGSALGAALSSFAFFATGAAIPLLPYLVLQGLSATMVSVGLVTVALALTGATVGILSGASPLKRGLRQVAIGLGAAAVTFALGSLFGA